MKSSFRDNGSQQCNNGSQKLVLMPACRFAQISVSSLIGLLLSPACLTRSPLNALLSCLKNYIAANCMCVGGAVA